MNEIKKIHDLHVFSRAGLDATGVTKVICAKPETVRLATSDGNLEIDGKNLKIKKYDETSGEFSLSGEIISLKYEKPKTSFVKRIFK
jgi:sporulation protein YabP